MAAVGTGDTLVLYDELGRPVTVVQKDGEMRLATNDVRTQAKLDAIIVLLSDIRDLLREKQ